LDCGNLVPLSRSQPAGPAPLKLSTRQVSLRPSPGSRGSVLAPPNKQSSPPNKLAEGSGLLGESQLSGRTECARPAPPTKPSQPPSTPQALQTSNFSLLTSHFSLLTP
jgi:hypothetical protein